MIEFERTELIDSPGITVPRVSRLDITSIAQGDYQSSYTNLTKGIGTTHAFTEALSAFPDNDVLGKTWFRMRGEAIRIQSAELFPHAVTDGISSVWLAAAIVWMYDQNNSVHKNNQFNPLNRFDELSLLTFFPLGTFLAGSKKLLRTSDSEWNKSQLVKYAGILLDGNFYKGCEVLKKEDPDSHSKIFRQYTAGSLLGRERYTFLSGQHKLQA